MNDNIKNLKDEALRLAALHQEHMEYMDEAGDELGQELAYKLRDFEPEIAIAGLTIALGFYLQACRPAEPTLTIDETGALAGKKLANIIRQFEMRFGRGPGRRG